MVSPFLHCRRHFLLPDSSPDLLGKGNLSEVLGRRRRRIGAPVKESVSEVRNVANTCWEFFQVVVLQPELREIGQSGRRLRQHLRHKMVSSDRQDGQVDQGRDLLRNSLGLHQDISCLVLLRLSESVVVQIQLLQGGQVGEAAAELVQTVVVEIQLDQPGQEAEAVRQPGQPIVVKPAVLETLKAPNVVRELLKLVVVDGELVQVLQQPELRRQRGYLIGRKIQDRQ
eukprot:767876-Hanusia_phi.AAC.7